MQQSTLQTIAGTIATLIFVGSSLPMLWKAVTTKNLASYSLIQISLSNTGNLFHWLYVIGLPFGPIWLLHAFNTLVAVLMLGCYLRYEKFTFHSVS